ncbi:MAG TPA: alpha/beta hydrolase [Mycobacteriales bacterium]|nr:alpha/beta hydrolase [Mycobacteriales bacterium]
MQVNQPIDPEVAAALAALPDVVLDADRLAIVRAARAEVEVPLSDAVVRSDHVVPGDPGVPVRVHRSATATSPRPGVISLHGGGLVLGTKDQDDPLWDRWCPKLDVVAVSVDYRLAPETPYPGPIEDCYAALCWTHEHAAELGIDPARIGVRGVSAGGGLAAALALLARERGGPALAFQLLDCPMLDDRQITPSSRLDGLLVWSRESNTFGWRSYLGDLYGTDDVPATAAPARATDLSGLPPAFVSVGSVDGFRDEDVDYAQRLNEAGVPCELHVYPGAPHGYALAFSAAVTKQSLRDMFAWLARQTA